MQSRYFIYFYLANNVFCSLTARFFVVNESFTNNYMSAWEGFTDAELQKIQITGNHSANSKRPEKKPKIVKPVNRKKNNVNSSSSHKLKTNNANQQKITSTATKQTKDIPSEALFTYSKSTTVSSKFHLGNNLISGDTENVSNAKEKVVAMEKSDCIFDDKIIQEKEKIKLEDVQLRQRQMEERNRKKKDMLTKEIAARKKKAFAESSKLAKIQQELTKLDELLNIDVSILRDKIDEACFEFSLAQKRFSKAEAEYVSAKMHLNDKTVLKEDLTEHLFNLIQANEDRKAKKLEELMHKLDVEEVELEEKEAKQKLENASLSNSSSHTQNENLTEIGNDQSVTDHQNPVQVKITSTSPVVDTEQSNGESLHGATH